METISKHNIFMTIEEAKKIANGTHEISGLLVKERRIILTSKKTSRGEVK
tara:strand:+ start:1279 stop:1428 length:150 start_codon:yes stop_codon:yes gene_type:complete